MQAQSTTRAQEIGKKIWAGVRDTLIDMKSAISNRTARVSLQPTRRQTTAGRPTLLREKPKKKNQQKAGTSNNTKKTFNTRAQARTKKAALKYCSSARKTESRDNNLAGARHTYLLIKKHAVHSSSSVSCLMSSHPPLRVLFRFCDQGSRLVPCLRSSATKVSGGKDANIQQESEMITITKAGGSEPLC